MEESFVVLEDVMAQFVKYVRLVFQIEGNQ